MPAIVHGISNNTVCYSHKVLNSSKNINSIFSIMKVIKMSVEEEMPVVSTNCSSICCIFEANRKTFTEEGHSSIDFSDPRRDDLFWSLRHFLRFGKIVGVVPFDGVFIGGLGKLRLRWKTIGSIYSIIVMLIILLNMIIGFMGLIRFSGKNATEWAWSAESFIFYTMGFFAHVYFLTRGERLISILHNWSSLKLYFSRSDMHLSRDINAIASIIFTSAILENALLQVIFFMVPQQNFDVKSPLLKYYEKAQNHWSEFIPYHEALSILIFFSNKFALYAWNFIDILIIVMSRALYHKFKILNAVVEDKFMNCGSPSWPALSGPENWKSITKDHQTLCALLAEFERFLSPLIFASYAINSFYICLQLHLGLTAGANNSILERIYAIWSFVHLVFRVFFVSFSASKVHDHAHRTLDILNACPEFCETRNIERARFKLATSKIGLSGLGCFIITRPFILKIISVIFTFEIVLLQAPGTGVCLTQGEEGNFISNRG